MRIELDGINGKPACPPVVYLPEGSLCSTCLNDHGATMAWALEQSLTMHRAFNDDEDEPGSMYDGGCGGIDYDNPREKP